MRATPPGQLERAWRRIKRRRGLIVLATLLVVAPAAGVLEWRRRELERAHVEALAREAKEKRDREVAQGLLAASQEAQAAWSEVLGAPSFDTYKRVAGKLDPICAKFPQSPVPFIFRGLAHAFSLQHAQAKKDLELARANLASPESPGPKPGPGTLGLDSILVARSGVQLALLRGEPEQAVAIARAALALQDHASLRIGLARALLRLGRAPEAETALGPTADGLDDEALAVGASVALARGDVAAAETRARKALEKNATSNEALTVAGRAALERGDVESAREQLRKARDAFGASGPPEARYFLELGKNRRYEDGADAASIEGAVLADDLAAALAPWSPIPLFWRAEASWLDRSNVADGIADLDEALRRDPLFAEAAEIRAELLLARRDGPGRAAAEATFRAEVARAARAGAALDLAVLLLGKGDLAGAQPLLEGGNAEVPRAQLLLAELHRKAGRDAEAAAAEERWTRSERRDDARRRDTIALARARLLAGDAKLALDVLKDARQDNERRPFYLRLPKQHFVLHALRGAAHAALGEAGPAFDEIQRAGFTTRRGTWRLAPEATPAVLTITPELASLKGQKDLEELTRRGRPGP